MIDSSFLGMAAREDLPALVELLSALFAIEKDFAVDRLKQERGLLLMLSAPDRAAIMVCREKGTGDVLGMATAQLLVSTAAGGLSAQVEDVVVRADARGRGIGTRLLDACGDWSRERGAMRLVLSADERNQRAEEFYFRRGWVRSGMRIFRLDLSRDPGRVMPLPD
jgi:GNAT superfamily N-acetyltransferase